MVVWIASTQCDARFPDIIEVKLWVAWGCDSHASEHADHRADNRDAHDQEKLTDLVGDIQDVPVTSRDDSLLQSKVWVGRELIEWVHPAVANCDAL